MSGDVPEPLLDPLSDLYDARTNLSTWVTAVKLQRERLQENITKARIRPGRVVPNDEVWSWLLRQGADALMFVLAIDQVCDAARAVRHRAPADVIPEIDEALAGFEAACPDRKALRNAVTHYADYLRGAGHSQADAASPEANYGLADPDTFYYSIEEGLPFLEIDFGEAVTAASTLERAVTDALAAARARRRQPCDPNRAG